MARADKQAEVFTGVKKMVAVEISGFKKTGSI